MVTATSNINQAIDAYKSAAKGTAGNSSDEKLSAGDDDFASLVKGATISLSSVSIVFIERRTRPVV